MYIKSIIHSIHVKVFFIVLLTTANTLASANEDPKNVRFYGHIGGGIGIDFFQSPDIENTLPGFTIINLGFPISGILRAGYSNIIQVEYRKLFAGADHTMETENQFSTTQFEIDMSYNQNDILIKINPYFGGYHSDINPFFSYLVWVMLITKMTSETDLKGIQKQLESNGRNLEKNRDLLQLMD